MSKSFASLNPKEFRALVEVSLAKQEFNRVCNLVSLPNCPPDILAYFAQDYVAYASDDKITSTRSLKPYESRKIIAVSMGNPNLPMEVIQANLDRVSFSNENNNLFSLYRLLANPSLTAVMLTDLHSKAKAAQKEYAVSYPITIHPNCPIELLEEIAEYSTINGRRGGANSPKINDRLIQKLLNDKDNYTRVLLAQNPVVPLNTFDEIIKNEINLKGKDKLDPRILYALIRRSPSGARREELIALLLGSTKNSRARLIAVEFTSDPVIANKGCYDKKSKVRKRAVRNPVTPPEGHVAATLLN